MMFLTNFLLELLDLFDSKGKIVISHQKWKIAILESLMNFKHERSNSKIFMISG